MTPEPDLEKCGAVVHPLTRRMLPDKHHAEDVSQEVLLKCWKFLQEKGFLPPQGYLVQMTKNACCTWVRKRDVQKPLHALEFDLQDPKEKDPATALADREQVRAIALELDRLPPRYRESTRLSLIEAWSVEQIAMARNPPSNTVKTQVRRGKKLLQKRLGCQFGI